MNTGFHVLPSGIQPDEPSKRSTVKVAKGLYVVPTSYEGVYDYFGHSPLINLSHHPKPAVSNGNKIRFRVTEHGIAVADSDVSCAEEVSPEPSPT